MGLHLQAGVALNFGRGTDKLSKVYMRSAGVGNQVKRADTQYILVFLLVHIHVSCVDISCDNPE